MKIRDIRVRVPLVGLAALVSGCKRDVSAKSIIIGCKNFTEQTILGEILAQRLETQLGLSVTRKFHLGGALIAHQAMLAGEIDIYPEYSGTALATVLKAPLQKDRQALQALVKEQYQRQFQIVIPAAFGFNNTFAMTVRSRDAQRLSSAKLSAATTRDWRLGVGFEFQGRSDGMPALKAAYGLTFSQVSTMDLGLLYRALREDRVDMVAANSTDGILSTEEFTVLADDRQAFPPYDALCLVRQECLDRVAGLRESLSQLEGKLTETDIRHLNLQVDSGRKTAAEAARGFWQKIEKKNT
jgi:glycine betaine/choline ABC-type transport system substrate-binding protein